AMLIVVEGLLEHLDSAVVPPKRRPLMLIDRGNGRMLVAPGAVERGLNEEVGVASAMLAVATEAAQVVLEGDQPFAGDESLLVVENVVTAVRIVLRKIPVTRDTAAV